MFNAVAERMIVLDDGQYYIELVTTKAAAVNAPGLLKRRCYVSPTSPDGYEVLGVFHRLDDGEWDASIDASVDPVTGIRSRELGPFSERLSAAVALWNCRRQAHSRHQDD